ncbi:MAG: hypothetical protein EPN61_14930, partial [Burkholderiaceae bacterium]
MSAAEVLRACGFVPVDSPLPGQTGTEKALQNQRVPVVPVVPVQKHKGKQESAEAAEPDCNPPRSEAEHCEPQRVDAKADTLEAIEERAAILEFDAGMSRADAEREAVQMVTEAQTVARVRARFKEACAGLPVDPASVLGQFDRWHYTGPDLREMDGWPDATIEAHCRLLVKEQAGGTMP